MPAPPPPNESRWKKGQSGNPSGKRKDGSPIVRDYFGDVRQLAKKYTEDAIRTLAKVLRHKKASESAKVAAAIAILDRGWGKPAQLMEIRGADPLDGLTNDQLRALGRTIESALGIPDGAQGADSPETRH